MNGHVQNKGVGDHRSGQETDLINIVKSNNVVEQSVEVIEKIYNLKRRAGRGYGREAHNVREVDTDTLEDLWRHLLSQF